MSLEPPENFDDNFIQDSEDHSSPKSTPFLVKSHIRSFTDGRHASDEKVATAAEYGFNLGENQTWVKAYQKGSSDC